jgi:hypothetical protein
MSTNLRRPLPSEDQPTPTPKPQLKLVDKPVEKPVDKLVGGRTPDDVATEILPAPSEPKRGRPRKFPDNAAKQRAHRAKKAAAKACELRIALSQQRVPKHRISVKEESGGYDGNKLAYMAEAEEARESGRRVRPYGHAPESYETQEEDQSKTEYVETEETFLDHHPEPGFDPAKVARQSVPIKLIRAARLLCPLHSENPPTGSNGVWHHDTQTNVKKFLFGQTWNKKLGLFFLSCGCPRAFCLTCGHPITLSDREKKCACQK